MKLAVHNVTQLWAVNWRHRWIIVQMVGREVASRYRGSILGLAWSVVHPLAMLLVYTFAFNVVFKSRWPGKTSTGEEVNFAVAMFLGFIIYALAAEILNRAPMLVLGHANYVKKVVFPLEILATVAVGAALFNAGVSLVIWVILFGLIHHALPWAIVFLPIILFPLVLMSIGLLWLFGSLGVFIRDLAQVMSLITMSLLFLSPIFYPAAALPAPFDAWMHINPLTGIIEDARKVAIEGYLPDWRLLTCNFLVGLLIAHLGFLWFVRTRWGFADVL